MQPCHRCNKTEVCTITPKLHSVCFGSVAFNAFYWILLFTHGNQMHKNKIIYVEEKNC